MSGKSFRLLFVSLALLTAGCPADPPESTAPPPNLLLITVDTLRADRLGCYGHETGTTPVVDALAREGLLFENATTCIPRTTQALASLFTSPYPHEHGVLEIGDRLPEAALTLAELLAEAGYSTAAISANAVAGPNEGLDQGFESFISAEQLQDKYPIWRDFHEPRQPPYVGWAEALTREAMAWLERQSHGPWFLWLLSAAVR